MKRQVMNKIIKTFLCIPFTLVVLLTTSCLKPEPCNSTFQFEQESVTLKVGEEVTLQFSGYVSKKTQISWSVEKPNVASVDNGTVRALHAGTTLVYAEATINGVKKTAQCTIIVPSEGPQFTDPNLPKRILQLHPEIDINKDGAISPEEALLLTELNLAIEDKTKATAEEKITSVEGIELFSNLTSLNLKNQFIKDASPIEALTKLEKLYITYTEIPSIQVKGMPALRDLRLFGNKNLTAIDVRSNTKLDTLYIQDTQLSEIDLTNNKELIDLNLNRTKLTRLILADLPKLNQVLAVKCEISTILFQGLPTIEKIYIDNNQLTRVALKDLPALMHLSVYSNKLQTLELDLPKLMFLHAHENELRSVDLSKLPMLFHLDIDKNPLVKIELSTNKIIRDLRADNTPSLEEINLRNGEYNEDAQYEIKEGNTGLKRVLVDSGDEETHLRNLFPAGSGVAILAQ